MRGLFLVRLTGRPHNVHYPMNTNASQSPMPHDPQRQSVIHDIATRVRRAAHLDVTAPAGKPVAGVTPGTAAGKAHQSLRQTLQEDVEAFQRAGGKIEQLGVLERFKQSDHVGYEILYGAKDGRRWKSGGRGG